MKQLGIIVYKIYLYEIYIVHIGLGQLRYFRSKDNLNVGDVIVYYNYIEEDNDGYIIEYKSSLNDYHYIGNIRFDYHHSTYEQFRIDPDKIIARKKDFVIWDREDSLGCIFNRTRLDERTNSLLFRLYAENRYTPIGEADILNIFIKAKEKVESLNITEIINGLTVKIQNHSIIRRGSDNYLMCWTTMESSYGYDIYGDPYFNTLFPSLDVELTRYDEKEDETTTHPDYLDKDQWENIAKQKEREIKLEALNIYSNKYSKEAHINHIVFREVSSKMYNYEEDQRHILSMKAKAEIYWDNYFFEDIAEQIIKQPDQFVNIIKDHNSQYDLEHLFRRGYDNE